MPTVTPRFAMLAAVSLMTLAACKDDDRSARVALPDPGPLGYVAGEATLEPAPPARISRYAPEAAYGWAERAYSQQAAFYEEPPTYGFEYGEEEPWVWRTEDDWSMYAEPWDDGYRYYFYEPGSAYPYFVRDDRYGYGYDPSGVLVAVFDATGGYLPEDRFAAVAPYAGRYWTRGHELRSAGMRAQRITVSDRDWAARAPIVTRSAEPWLRAARQEPQWTAWRKRHGRAAMQTARAEPPSRDFARTVSSPGLERRLERAEAHADKRVDKADASIQRQVAHEARREAHVERRAPAAFAQAHGRPAAAFEAPRGGPKPDRAPAFGAPSDHGGGHPHGGPKAAFAAPSAPQGGGNPHGAGGEPHGGGNPHGGGEGHGGGNPHAGGDGHGGGHGKKG